MNKNIILLFCLCSLYILSSCGPNSPQSTSEFSDLALNTDSDTLNLLADVVPRFEDGDVNAVIEIPAGTLEKWELDKSTGKIQWELIDNIPRIVNYLGYPGNYGMIPGTLLSKEKGGDGDPLDILVLGPPVERGHVVKCKIIGVLYLVDNGEQDNKLIAVSGDSPLYGVNSIDELNDDYKGIPQILQLWFTNYKGPGKIESRGFGDKNNAVDLLEAAINEYQLGNTDLNKK
jgi:inorganic pyrophosphatase